MGNKAAYEIKEEKITGYKFKLKLKGWSDDIIVTLERGTFSGTWNMKWNQRVSLDMIATLIQTIFEIKGSEIEYLAITLPAFPKEQKTMSFKKNPENDVNGYIEILTRIIPDEVIF